MRRISGFALVSLSLKKTRLIARLKGFEKLAVALSGGVDSALLLAVAHEVIGDGLIAVTAGSPIHPQQELNDAKKIADMLGITHLVLDSDEMTQPGFLSNTPERCYVCKKHVFSGMLTLIRKTGIRHLAHGANADDVRDYRPGLKAARELGVVAPLMDAGLTKPEIRQLARQRGLPVWDKPAMACIATRFPYGTPIVLEKVVQVRDAEQVLAEAGFSGCRVRHHGALARIEVSLEDLPVLIADPMRSRIALRLRQIGFLHICADLEGYVTGSMNRALTPGAKD
ncbi:7-cyano-7-deazaguanine synthase [Desulfosarcina ovata subsp. sediminis]|uniref:7-cyano-7-deazaguanine synthase n=1 Tax=Desulfosarcina ovata subsp. sediminis TaxID=885957 RepID=A0A5K7ZMS9_9BACT|nr:ATP-dependent sacrificial sulfur transferase LarE [Desulfosarcina ovata]BBO81477.1 7-cyano-7-deazaguanine synthase [Desulfosarcina ovata subsp. sediminis]